MRRRHAALLVLLVLLGCGTMAWVETGPAPDYWTKSLWKVLVFFGCSALYLLLTRDPDILRAFRFPDPISRKWSAALALAVFVFLLGGCALLSPWLDLSAITGNLGAKEGITAATFPVVAVYISFGNSLLEEWFFRGFAFLGLREACPGMAGVFSAVVFALYHVCIMGSWFHPLWFLLLTAGLAVAGGLFNWLDRKGSLWCGWLVHVAANLAINTIGLHLFGYF